MLEKHRQQGPPPPPQGNSVARDLPPTGSEANTTIFYILDIDSRDWRGAGFNPRACIFMRGGAGAGL